MPQYRGETRNTPRGRRAAEVTTVLLAEPHIGLTLLEDIHAPTLVLSGDHNLIRLERTIAINEALFNAQIAVFSNNTHIIPFDDPQTFHATVEKFLATSFRKIDRIPATIDSLERLLAGLAR